MTPEFNQNRLYAATVNSDVAAIETLARAGVQVNHEDASRAPLFAATSRGVDVAVVKALVAFKADVNQADSAGDTPLLIALGKGHNEHAVVLLGAGANPNAANKKGMLPLMAAIDAADVTLVDGLLRKGAVIDHPDVPNSRQNMMVLARGWNDCDAETEEKFATIRELLDRASPAQISPPARAPKLQA